MAGFFVTGLNQRRRLLQTHVAELEAEVRLRKDAESQIRVLIETSPLAHPDAECRWQNRAGQ